MSNKVKMRNEVYEGMKHIMSLETRSEGDLAKYDDLENQYNELTAEIEREVRFEAATDAINSVMDTRQVHSGQNDGDDEVRSAFLNYVRTGDVSEIRNINSFSSAEGGVNVPTILFSAIEKAIADVSVMRNIGGRVISTTSTTTLPLANNAPTALWKAQNPSGSYDETDQLFNSATLNAYKLTGLVKISEEVLQDSATDLEATVAANLGTAFGNAEEIAFVSGSGVEQPLGLLRQTTAGGNAVLTQNLGTATGSYEVLDAVIDGYYKMPQNRRQNSVFVVGDGLAKVMRKSKDSSGQYLWEVSPKAGQPDMFMGRPVYTTDAAPTAWQPTTGVMGALVNPAHYVIGDRGGYQIQRLNELYAAEGNVGFKAYKRVDHALLDGNSLVKYVSNVA